MTALIENYNQQLNEIYLMYADEVVKNRSLSNITLIYQIHEAFEMIEDIKLLLKERDNLIIKFKIKIMEHTCIICNENLKNENIRWLISCKCVKLFHDRCLLDRWHLIKIVPSVKINMKKIRNILRIIGIIDL